MKIVYTSLCLLLLMCNLATGQNISDQVLLVYKVKPLNPQKTNYQVKSLKVYFWKDKSRIEFVNVNPLKPNLEQRIVIIHNDQGEYSISEGNLEYNPFGVSKLAIFVSKDDSIYKDKQGLYEPIYCKLDWAEGQLTIGHLTAYRLTLTNCEDTKPNAIAYALKNPSIPLGLWFPEIQHVPGTPIQFNSHVGNMPVSVSVLEVKRMQANPNLFVVPAGYKTVTARDALNFLRGHH